MSSNNACKINIEDFVSDNIIEINNGIRIFLNGEEAKLYDETEIKRYLKNKIYREYKDKEDVIISKIEGYDSVKKGIVELANELVFYKKDLNDFLESTYLGLLNNDYSDEMKNKVVNSILNASKLDEKVKGFLKSTLMKITDKSMLIILQNGFSSNVNNIESGIMTANAGDSAQFLFLSRAILAGYNCSNVDVRSSRYDAVIDINDRLLRVQVKGISGNTISLIDRARGGRGVDYQNPRNQGKRVTSKECDLYVAVDKQVGICYIIPLKLFDDDSPSQVASISLSTLVEYRENWKVINDFIL